MVPAGTVNGVMNQSLLLTSPNSKKISLARSVVAAVTWPRLTLPSSNDHHRGLGMPSNCSGVGMVVRITEPITDVSSSASAVARLVRLGSTSGAHQSKRPDAYSVAP
jgi:hypothetical protein